MEYETVEAIITLASGLIATIVAILAYAVAPRAAAHRALAFVLLLEGAFWLIPQGLAELVFGASFSLANPFHYALWSTIHVAWTSVGWAYIIFGVYGTEWTPMKKLRRPWFLGIMGVLLVATSWLQLAAWRALVAGDLWAIGEYPVIAFPDIVKGLSSLGVLIVIALSIRELRAAGGTTVRAKAMLWAFGVRDVVWVLLAIYQFLPVPIFADPTLDKFMRIMLFSSLGIYAFMVGRAIMLGKILDVQHRVHFVVQRGTLAGIFVAVFVGVQTLISEFVTDTIGLLAGATSAAGLVVVLGPLQKMAERVADKAVPRGQNSLAMTPAERDVFYREQVVIAYSDGVIGSKERNALKSVRERIGLSAAAALKIEDAVVAA